MRVAQVAPIARPVSPGTASSIEQVVWSLTEELVRRGVEVTLFATGDSTTSAPLVARYPAGYTADPALWTNWQCHELAHTASALGAAAGFDVVHSHVYAFPAPLVDLVDTAVVHTDHCAAARPAGLLRPLPTVARGGAVPAPPGAAGRPAGRGGGAERGRRRPVPPRRRRGLPAHPGSPDPPQGTGRGRPGRPPRRYAAGARRQGRRGLVRGARPAAAGPPRRALGREVDVAERNRLLAGARALLFTSQRAEPFDLVLVEAMACGTPVAALDRCAVREIVQPGFTGVTAAQVEQLAALVPEVARLDRARVRAEAARRFDVRRMTEGYLQVYADHQRGG